MKSEWNAVRLGDIITLNYGKALPERARIRGNIPVYSSAGITGQHNSPLINSEGLVIGRKGTIGTVYYAARPFFCIDTAYYVLPSENYDLKYIYYLLTYLNLSHLNEDSAVPGLNRETAYSQMVYLPKIQIQGNIASVLSRFDDKIELNQKINHNLPLAA